MALQDLIDGSTILLSLLIPPPPFFRSASSHTRSARVRATLTTSIGPAFAIPAVLTKAGISKDDVDFYEINEAFASQAVMSIQHLHLPYEKVNPVGGAIALGHPLGCTGARQVATALSEAKREKKKIFVTSMCIGSGMVSLLSFLSSLLLSIQYPPNRTLGKESY